MNKMTTAFKNVVNQADKLEESATSILVVAQQEKVLTVEEFDQLVSQSYQEMNYSQQVGRPAEGSTLLPAPPTLRNYISIMRRMYKLKLDVMSFKTMMDVRKGIKDAVAKRKVKVAKSVDELAAMRGVKIAKEEEMIGAVVHDIGVVMKHLDRTDQDEFEQKLQKLLRQFSKKAHLEMAAAA